MRRWKQPNLPPVLMPVSLSVSYVCLLSETNVSLLRSTALFQ
jgi:hypothetical protein